MEAEKRSGTVKRLVDTVLTHLNAERNFNPMDWEKNEVRFNRPPRLPLADSLRMGANRV